VKRKKGSQMKGGTRVALRRSFLRASVKQLVTLVLVVPGGEEGVGGGACLGQS
jgi:hypothetical protein